MKITQLTIVILLLLFLSSGCKKSVDNNDFLQKEWKVQSVAIENKRTKIPSENDFLREEAYILKFINDSCFTLNTNVNYAGGKYQIVSKGRIVIHDYHEWTKVGTSEQQKIVNEQLLSAFNGNMSMHYSQNKLIFKGEKSNEVILKIE